MIFEKYKKYILLADQMLFSGLAFVITILLSRFLDIEMFGLFASLIIFLYLILSLSQAIFIQPMQILNSKTKNIKEYKTFLLLSLTVFLSLFFIIALIFQLLNIEIFENYNKFILSFSGFAVAFLTHDFFRKWFLSNDQVRSTFIIDIVSAIGQVVGFFVCFGVLNGSIETLLICLSISYIPAISLAFYKYNEGISFIGFGEFIPYHIKEGKWFLLTAITQWWSNNLFVISSGVFIGLEALGALRLGQSIFGILNILLQTVENYIIPSVNRLYLKSKDESIEFLQSLSKKSILPVFVILSSIFIFSKPLMAIVGGHDFIPFHIVLKGLSLLYFIIIIGYPIRISVRILELNKIFFLAYLAAFIMGLFTFQFLLSNYGLLGALAGLISNQLIMMFIWQSTLTRKKFKLWKSYTSF